jgi:ribonucleoside-diphosphate reductase alpha chain
MVYEKYWWLNEESQTILDRGYLLKGESTEDAIKRVAKAASNALNLPELEAKIIEAVEMGWISLSSPIWSNMGTERALPISCFNSHFSDSIKKIAYKTGEVIEMTRMGGGTSGYFGELRPRGAPIRSGGDSSGAVSFMQFPDTVVDIIRQGKTRRGAFASYLPIDHGDIEEFLNIKSIGSAVQNLFTGVCVSDEWMKSMIEGDVSKRILWAKVLQSRKEKGIPYIFFTDNVNKVKPDVYKDKSFVINASNLCVAGYTQILTDNGYQCISDLENENVNVWNGEKWSQTTVRKTGIDQKLVRITTNSGYELDCTPYHKFYIQELYAKSQVTEVEAKDLKQGDKLIKFELPLIEGLKTLDYAYDNGFYSGDGCLTPQGSRIYLYNDKRDLITKFNSVDKWTVQNYQNRIYGHTKLLKDKYFVPDSTYTIKSRLEWLAGYLDADGTVTNNNGSQSLQAASIDKEFLKEVQLMLQTLGCDSKVTFNRSEGMYLLPKNDDSGEMDYYKCKELNRLLINGNSLFKLSQLGLQCYRLQWIVKKPNRKCSQFIKIESVTKLNDLSDTYCFTEPLRNMGMFNGILTGQCSEIALPSTHRESFVCCLASLNAETYHLWKDTDVVETITFLLDGVMSEFIKKTDGMNLLVAANRFAKRHRALGIGLLGWHSFLQQNMIAFESFEAKSWTSKIFKQIKEQSYAASTKLAELYGEPSLLKGYGRRNTTLMAVAPNTSSSAILGQTSAGIEPYSSNYYKAGLAKGSFMRKNKFLMKVLEDKGFNNQETWLSILNNHGSVQHLSILTKEEKDVFKTFKELSQKEIIIQASIRQKFIDQSQSLNLNIPPDTPPHIVNELMILAWELGIKTLYYQRSQSLSKNFVTELTACVSCDG